MTSSEVSGRALRLRSAHCLRDRAFFGAHTGTDSTAQLPLSHGGQLASRRLAGWRHLQGFERTSTLLKVSTHLQPWCGSCEARCPLPSAHSRGACMCSWWPSSGHSGGCGGHRGAGAPKNSGKASVKRIRRLTLPGECRPAHAARCS